MKYNRFCIVVLLSSSLSCFHSCMSATLHQRVLIPKSSSINTESNSAQNGAGNVESALVVLGGVALGGGAKSLYDYIVNDDTSLNDLKTRLFSAETALKDANNKIDSLTSDLEMERSARVKAENTVVELNKTLSEKNKKVNEGTTKMKELTIAPESVEVLTKFINGLSYTISPHGSVLEDLLCLMMYQSKMKCDDKFYTRTRNGQSWENNARWAYDNEVLNHTALLKIKDYLSGNCSLNDLKECYNDSKKKFIANDEIFHMNKCISCSFPPLAD